MGVVALLVIIQLDGLRRLKVVRTLPNEELPTPFEFEKKNLKKMHENRTSFGLRTLLLPESHPHFGMSNQMSCLQLAAVLAKQYNRTLLVPPNGVSYNLEHRTFPIPFERVYDMQLSSERIPFHIDQSGAQQKRKTEEYKLEQQLPEYCQNIIQFDPKKVRTENLRRDPYPSEECIALHCHWTYVDFVAPPDIFPHVDQVFFPFNDIYRQAAVDVISSIKNQVLAQGKNETQSTFRLLALHVRRGDRSTTPLFNCSHLGDLYPYIAIKRGRSVACSSVILGNNTDYWEHVLTWDRVFEHIADPHCNNKTFPVCAVNYDAIFVATNDPTWVHNKTIQTKLPPLSMIGDFPFLKKILLQETVELDHFEESAEMLIIEEMIMALSSMFVPSFPSTITPVILRLRIENHDNEEKELAERLLDTHFEFRSQLDGPRAKMNMRSRNHRIPGK
jgi:hypothetical protein